MSDTKNRELENQKDLLLHSQKCRKKIREIFNSHFSLNKVPITFDQWLVVLEIKDTKGINQKTISSNLSKEVASISRIIKKLEDKGLIVRESNDQNLREFKTYLSPSGLELVDQITAFEHSTFKRIFSGIYEQEINLVNDVLKRIFKNL